MAFDGVYDGIAGILKGQGYSESAEADSFENASSREYGNTFILKPISGALVEGPDEGGETIINKFFDDQIWQVQIAFDKSKHNEVINRNDIHRKKDTLLNKLDNPANWSSFVRVLKYMSWEIEPMSDYYVLIINLKVIDTYTYS